MAHSPQRAAAYLPDAHPRDLPGSIRGACWTRIRGPVPCPVLSPHRVLSPHVCMRSGTLSMGRKRVGGTTSPAPTASILLGLADVLGLSAVRAPQCWLHGCWVASARGRSECRRRRKPGQKKIFLRQRSPQPRRKQARAHRQVAGQPNGLLRLHRLASSFALRRAGPFVSSKERTFGRPEGS